MIEAIKLKIPENPSAEKVSVGNFEAELKPGSTIEVENRQFADYLIGNYGAVEVVSKKKKETSEPVKDFGFPEGFPASDIFVKREIPHETVLGLNEDQLLKIEGIGKETANSILNFKFPPIVPTAKEMPIQNESGEAGANNSADGGKE